MALTDKLKAIANAIRGKTGSTDLMTLDEMPTEIENIQTGASIENAYMEIGIQYVNGGGLDLVVDATYHGQYIPEHLCSYWGDLREFTFKYGPDSSSIRFYEILSNAFYNCKSLESVNLPSEIVAIYTNAFYNCKSLALTSLPDGIREIGTNAFYNCKSLALTSLPDGIREIGSYAFQDCTSLALTSLPDGIREIGTQTFYNCDSLVQMLLPEGVETIGLQAFASCSNLTAITFKGTPTKINSMAFSQCPNLTIINVPWSEGEVANAPWGATNATINYNCAET